MVDASSSAVNAEFARWYRATDFGDDPQRYERRQVGVIRLASEATRSDVEALVQLIFRIRQPPSHAALDRILKPFREADSAFDAASNNREAEILAGAALHVMMINGGNSGGVAALAVTTAGLGGGRLTDLPVDLVAAAEAAIPAVADGIRQRPDLARYKLDEPPALKFDKAAAKVREAANQWENIALAFDLAAGAAHAVMEAIAKRNAAAVADVGDFIAIQDEELQMLWWLVGERSWDLDRAFTAVPVDAQPLIFGKELASLTEFPPGPRSVKSLLSRAGLKDRKRLSIPAAVNACPSEWLGPLVSEDDPSPVIHPLHFAIKRKLETGEDRAWIENWAAVTGVDAGHTLGQLTAGTLFYRERLLAPFFKK